MSTVDLHDRLKDSNLGNWLIFPINGSSISWTRGGRYSSDTDHDLVNSSILDKILSTYFCWLSSISDHKSFL